MAVLVKGGGSKPEEEKTVTAGTSAIEVSPSTGKVIKKVTVNPTPSQSKTVTPTAAGLTVSPDSGKLLSSVEVNGDANLIADNIKNGVSIFGITGTMNGGFPNGTEWSTECTFQEEFTEIIYGNGIYLAASSAYYIRYSYDGKVWNKGYYTSYSNNTVYYLNGIFFLVTGNSTDGFRLYYSNDGINWSFALYLGKYGGAIVYNGYQYVVSASSGIYISVDGVNWSNKVSIVSSEQNKVGKSYCAGNKIYAVIPDGTYYSEDYGNTWTIISALTNLRSIYYKKGTYVADVGGTIKYSTDGINWTTTDSEFTTANKLVLIGDMFFHFRTSSSSNSYGLRYSNDGVNWSQTNITTGYILIYNSIPNMQPICYENGLYVVSIANSGIYYSTDGINWIQSNLTSGSCSFCYDNGIWLATYGYYLYYSVDGITWIDISIVGVEMAIRDIMYCRSGIWLLINTGKDYSSNTRIPGIYYSVAYESS